MNTARDRPPEEAAEDTSFARGLRVLLTIADRGEVRADELGALLDTPVSTIYRYLRTLSEFGFVDRTGSGYRLGQRLVIGGGTHVSTEALIRLADPTLRSLVAETGETAVLMRRIGLSAVCLLEVPSPQALRVNIEVGAAMPLHIGAIARTLLAYAPPDVLDELVKDQVVGGPPIRRKELRKELANIVTTGIARSEGEPIPSTVTMAVPIIRDDGIVGAIGVIGPDSRGSLAWRARVARLLPDAAAAIAGSLGGSPRP